MFRFQVGDEFHKRLNMAFGTRLSMVRIVTDASEKSRQYHRLD